MSLSTDKVVLANATLVHVSETSYPDLYFALRGGMNNFGVVNYFTMTKFPQDKLWSGTTIFPAEERQAVVEQAHLLTTEWKNDTKLAFSYGYAYNQTKNAFSLSFTEAYTNPIENPSPFQTLNTFDKTSSTLRTVWMSEFVIEGASSRPKNQGRNLYATLSYAPSKEIDLLLQDIYAEEIMTVRNLPGFSPNLIIQPIYQAAIVNSRLRGGSALGLESEDDKPFSITLLIVQWQHATDDEALYSFSKRFIARGNIAIEAAGAGNRWLYVNYANQLQDHFAGYGEGSQQRLIRMQKEVDPLGVFTSRGLCRGYFKLW